MNLEHPNYWLAYLSESVEDGPAEVTAIAPCAMDRPRLTYDTRGLLAAADAYHDEHPHERVVFAAAVTRWLSLSRSLRWYDLDIDFYAALAELDAHAPALLIEASPIVMAVVGNAATHHVILVVGEKERCEPNVEDVRALMVAALEQDWPAYIRRVLSRYANQS